MRILVYPHDLSIGGSQINAIDLAAGAQAAGHEVIVYGVPGPLVDYIAEKGLRFISAHPMKYRPAPSRVLQLASIARRERIDLIHAYEWPPCLDAYYGASLFCGIPVLCTVLSMSVSAQIPRSVPLIMGTEELGGQARAVQSDNVWVIEPPIDVERDNPSIDGRPFRAAHAIGEEDFLVVTVSRLALDLKLDALVRAIDTVGQVGQKHAIKLALVGDGPARNALEARATTINNRLGRKAIIFCGQKLDPRQAYAAADLVVGMGSSALRALAIGRPVIIQGEQAFSEIFEPATLHVFLHQGFYGHADSASNVDRLCAQIEELMQDGPRRAELSRYGRQIVVDRFSLQRASDQQLDIYRAVLANPVARSALDAIRSGFQSLKIEQRYHNPFFRRSRKAEVLQLLSSAQSGSWPPSQTR